MEDDGFAGEEELAGRVVGYLGGMGVWREW